MDELSSMLSEISADKIIKYIITKYHQIFLQDIFTDISSDILSDIIPDEIGDLMHDIISSDLPNIVSDIASGDLKGILQDVFPDLPVTINTSCYNRVKSNKKYSIGFIF